MRSVDMRKTCQEIGQVKIIKTRNMWMVGIQGTSEWYGVEFGKYAKVKINNIVNKLYHKE